MYYMTLKDPPSQGLLSTGPYHMLGGMEDIDGFVCPCGTGYIKAHVSKGHSKQVSKGVWPYAPGMPELMHFIPG